MITILLTAVISIFLYQFHMPEPLIYTITGISLLAAVVVGYSVISATVSQEDVDPEGVQILAALLATDKEVKAFTLELSALFILQIANITSISNEILMLFFATGTILVIRNMINYLDNTYYDEISVAVEELKNNNNKDE